MILNINKNSLSEKKGSETKWVRIIKINICQQ